jgi:hypothetical protein
MDFEIDFTLWKKRLSEIGSIFLMFSWLSMHL